MKQQIDYKQYLASREWRVRRKKFIEEATYGVCERCAARPIENVHHLTYANVGNEDAGDLLGVCRPCHEYLAAERDDDPALEVIQKLIDQHGLFPLEDWPSQDSWPWPLFVSGESINGLTLLMRLIPEEDASNYEVGQPKRLLATGVMAAFTWLEDGRCLET